MREEVDEKQLEEIQQEVDRQNLKNSQLELEIMGVKLRLYQLDELEQSQELRRMSDDMLWHDAVSKLITMEDFSLKLRERVQYRLHCGPLDVNGFGVILANLVAEGAIEILTRECEPDDLQRVLQRVHAVNRPLLDQLMLCVCEDGPLNNETLMSRFENYVKFAMEVCGYHRP